MKPATVFPPNVVCMSFYLCALYRVKINCSARMFNPSHSFLCCCLFWPYTRMILRSPPPLQMQQMLHHAIHSGVPTSTTVLALGVGVLDNLLIRTSTLKTTKNESRAEHRDKDPRERRLWAQSL